MDAEKKNHPGWGKGKRIRLVTGSIVTVVEDGTYMSSDTCAFWFYRIRYDDGRTATWVPQMDDEPIKNQS